MGSACDALVEPGYRGETVATLDVAVRSRAGLPARVYVSLSWSPCVTPSWLDGTLCRPSAEVGLNLADGEDHVAIPFYEAPPDDSFDLGGVPIARVLISTRPLDDPEAVVVGSSGTQRILFEPDPIWDPEHFLGDGPPEPGYALWVDLACETYLATGAWPSDPGAPTWRLLPWDDGLELDLAADGDAWPFPC